MNKADAVNVVRAANLLLAHGHMTSAARLANTLRRNGYGTRLEANGAARMVYVVKFGEVSK